MFVYFLSSCLYCRNTAIIPHHSASLGLLFSTQSQPVKQEGPDLSLLEPALQRQWDHDANAHLGKIAIKPHSYQQVEWICNQCPEGHLHSWSATVDNRSNGRDCPYCSGHKVCRHNSLTAKAPLLAAQWDFEANKGTSENVSAHSNQTVGWLCDVCGCKWSTAPAKRVCKKKTGCPHCAQVAAKTRKQIRHSTSAECTHHLLAEWDHVRNAAEGYFPDQIRLKSGRKIWWLCGKCPVGHEHSWSAGPNSRTGRAEAGCPRCAGQAACKCNSLQSLYPDIAAEWDHDRHSGQPSDYTASSSYLAWWSDHQSGSWRQTINSRTILCTRGPPG